MTKETFKKGDRIIRIKGSYYGATATVVRDEHLDGDGDLVIPVVFDNPDLGKWTEDSPYYCMHKFVQRLLESDILDSDED